jgi:hypothetical protein
MNMTAARPEEDWDALRAEWLPGDMRPPFTPDVIVRGFKAARHHLGDDWPQRTAGLSRSVNLVRFAVATGFRLDAVAHLPGANKLIPRLAREGEGSSARAELAVAAALHAPGIAIEIEPPVPEGESPPDVRATVAAHEVDIQVVQPEVSKEEWDAWQRLALTSQAIFGARSEDLFVEALVTWPIDPATELRMFEAAASAAAAVPGSHLPLPGIGALWISALPLDGRPFTRVEPPAADDEGEYFSGTVSPGVGRRVAIETRIPTSARLLKKLDRKRDQLRKDGRGVIVVDVTGMPDGWRAAKVVVPELLRQSGRVGAVVVFEDQDGRVLTTVNAQARRPLPDGFLEHLEHGLQDLIR